VARRLTDNGIAAFFWLSRSIASVKVLCAGLHTTLVDSVVISRFLYGQGYAGNRDVSWLGPDHLPACASENAAFIEYDHINSLVGSWRDLATTMLRKRVFARTYVD
jgi:hypothetical protein